jgi:hypothetical protein
MNVPVCISKTLFVTMSYKVYIYVLKDPYCMRLQEERMLTKVISLNNICGENSC